MLRGNFGTNFRPRLGSILASTSHRYRITVTSDGLFQLRYRTFSIGSPTLTIAEAADRVEAHVAMRQAEANLKVSDLAYRAERDSYLPRFHRAPTE